MIQNNDPELEAKIKAAKKMFMPKGPVCESMCKTCPFRPDGKGYARDHEDFPDIVQSVLLGLPFYCHQTVLMDPKTTFVGKGMNRTPMPIVQPHFKNCFGAVALKRGEIPNPLEAKPDEPKAVQKLPVHPNQSLFVGELKTEGAPSRPAKARPKAPARVRVLPKHRTRSK